MSQNYRVRPRSMVYVMTNASDDNEVDAFSRKFDGTLSLMDTYRTGGTGTGKKGVSPATPDDGIGPLASQGSLVVSRGGHFLFAVNAGSNSISSFKIDSNGGLTLVDVVPSGGLQPNSLDVNKKFLYVSHVGSYRDNFSSNITGFRMDRNGGLTTIQGSTRFLSTPDAQAARVVFNSKGNKLVVSELTTNRLSVFRVNRKGMLSKKPVINESSGAGPFGSHFLSSGLLLVAEAGINALSSYTLSRKGELEAVSRSVKNGQLATCWVVPTQNEHYAFTSNTANGTITSYRINRNGTIKLMRSIPSTPATLPLGAPIDSGVSRDGRNFYVLNGNQGSISVFKIDYYGRLFRLEVKDAEELPNLGAQGLAVR